MKTIVVAFLLFAVAVSFADAEQETIHRPSPSEMDMIVRTDKASYYACEPVTVIVSFVNKTDKGICLPFAKYDQWLCDYKLTLQSPVNTAQYINEEGDSWKIEERKAKSAPVSRYHKLTYGWGGDKGCYIPPHGTEIFKIPLSRCFDLSFPPGKYVVTVSRTIGYVPHKEKADWAVSCDVEGSAAFEMKWEHASSERIAFENMSRMLGGWKTVGLLCDEAEAILAQLEKKEERDAVNSSAYDRLMMILRTLDDVVNFDFSKINRSFIWEDGKLKPEEIRKFLEHSRSHLKQ
ncbi:MAG: hypothetical protein J5862_04125 [Bacteroidales bacterium]|nr:hypothetical protein [Bacteroidales bacterium]